ncbi:long-chain-fatty-acid--protein ligase LuxE [Photorhabdus laumondii]|uniref:long-chain-fatty-acid--protein ligase LuxE n=1 Tax=Photorhabdus laumondii TaxID=2218628 RepID=UPI003315AD6B
MTSYVDKQEITASSEIDDLIFSSDPLAWSYDEQEKIRNKLVLDAFRHHYKHCREYRHYCQAHKVDDNITEIDDIPVFPTSVFKFTRLLTSQENEIESWFTSSGTSGLKSQVARDRLTIERLLGSVSYGMKYVGSWFDHQIELVNLGPDRFNAHNIWFKYVMSLVELLYPTTFTVMEERIDFVKTLNSLERIKNQGKDICLIGSPYFIYLLCQYMKDKNISFYGDKNLYIITGGGWKSYEKESLKRDDFNHLLFDTFNLSNISQIRDIFNQVELNTCFFEDEMQRKRVPPWVYARALDPETLKPVPDGMPGLMSYMDASSTSYPAFIVTDDVGIMSREYGQYPGVLVEILRRVNTRAQKGCALSLTKAFDS